MNTSIQVLDPIVAKQNPRDRYRLTIPFMHGDADAQTEETYTFFPNDPYLLPIVELFSSLPAYLQLYTTSEWRMYLKGRECTDEFIDRILDMLVYDVTNDGNSLAIPETIKLTYFNEVGIEHATRIVFTREDS